jgi:hypothetical protein
MHAGSGYAAARVMPARLRAHPIAAADPTRAAHQVAAAALGDAPRGRPLTLAVIRWGAHAGLRPSPWVLDGVLHAIEELGLRGQALHVGERGAADPITARLAARGLPPLDARAPTLTLHAPGSRQGLRVPRPALGGSLCLVVPCVHRQHPGKEGPAWRGPLGEGLAALASAWGGSWARDPVDAAARALAELFAHVSVVIDASWWAPLAADDDAAPLLLAPERALGLRLPSPVVGPAALDPQLCDAWLGAQLGLPQRRRFAEAPRVVGPAARTPWPRLPRTPAREPAAGGTWAAPRAPAALGALWRRAQRPAPRRAALPPAVPGSLARLWDEYERMDRTSQATRSEGQGSSA